MNPKTLLVYNFLFFILEAFKDYILPKFLRIHLKTTNRIWPQLNNWVGWLSTRNSFFQMRQAEIELIHTIWACTKIFNIQSLQKSKTPRLLKGQKGQTKEIFLAQETLSNSNCINIKYICALCSKILYSQHKLSILIILLSFISSLQIAKLMLPLSLYLYRLGGWSVYTLPSGASSSSSSS